MRRGGIARRPGGPPEKGAGFSACERMDREKRGVPSERAAADEPARAVSDEVREAEAEAAGEVIRGHSGHASPAAGAQQSTATSSIGGRSAGAQHAGGAAADAPLTRTSASAAAMADARAGRRDRREEERVPTTPP